jgi:hypothetical protein
LARINIETSFYSDYRFLDLVARVGDRQKAQGIMLDIFNVAQKYWVPNEHPVPTPEFKRIPNYKLVMDAGLAEYCENKDFIYVKGSSTYFAWLIQRSRAGRQIKKNTSIAESLDNSLNGMERAVNGIEPLTLTPTLTQKKKRIEHAPKVAEFDFDLVYDQYPMKKGKKKGIAKCRTVIKTQSDFDRLLLAVKNYAIENEHLKGDDRRFIKHFSSFMSCWEDYLVSNHKPTAISYNWDEVE